MRVRLYGVVIETSFGFRSPLEPASEGCATDLELVYLGHAPEGAMPAPAGKLLSVPGVADYHLADERITARAVEGSDTAMVEIHFLSSAMTAWLEQRGTLALHASAVVVDGRAVAFLAGNRAGKTALAAASMQAGHPLLSDDILALDVPAGDEGPPMIIAQPGYPQMRMWDDNARHFLGDDWRELPVVHPRYPKRRVSLASTTLGRFAAGPAPLGALIVPRRVEPGTCGAPRLERLGASEIFLAMVRNTFSRSAIEDRAAQEDRLHRLATVVDEVGAWRLVYEAGYEQLDGVCDRLCATLRVVWAHGASAGRTGSSGLRDAE